MNFEHTSSMEKKYILESMSGGVALFDYDNDGWLDIYLLNSCTVGNAKDPHCARSALYHNNHDGTFTDVTERSGLAYPGFAMGVCTADLDGDGYEDVYVTAFGGNHLYHNNGDGSFTDITKAAGVQGGGWSTGCAIADYDHDGRLDIFVSRYVNFDSSNLPKFGQGLTCRYHDVPVQCGPRGLPGTPDLLFHNEGQGTFSEVSKKAGVADEQGLFGLGAVWFDYDGDGWPDLYVANDSGPNYLYRNRHDGTFEDLSFASGTALSQEGNEEGSMGVAVGDYNSSGKLSIFVTNFAEQSDDLYRHEPDDSFTEVSFASKTGESSLPFVKWGTAFLDFNNDGWPDLMVVNGHVYPQVDTGGGGIPEHYLQRKLLYENKGDGTFAEVAASHGQALLVPRASRGAAFGDLFNSGNVDVVVNNLDGKATILKNTGGAAHWITFRLHGSGTNRSAVGSEIHLFTGKHKQTQVVLAGSSYLSQDDKRLHFGLGESDRVDRAEVRWPDGSTTILKSLMADRFIDVEQASTDTDKH